MFWTIMLGILFILTITLLVFPIPYKDQHGNEEKSRVLFIAPLLLFILILCLTTIIHVDAKNVGVLTTGGAVSERTVDPGYALKFPWQSKTEIDGTVQTDRYYGKDCIRVQLGDGSESCIGVTNSWRINSKKADIIFQNYRSDDPTQQFRDAVVSTQLIASAVVVARDYNPIASLRVVDPGSTATPPTFGPDYTALSDKIKEDLIARTKGLADIESLNVTAVPLSASTQKKIDNFTAEVANTRTKQQEKLTKEAEAAGNRELANSIKNDPNLLISKCLDIVAEGKVDLPQTFTCNLFGTGGAAPVYSVNK